MFRKCFGRQQRGFGRRFEQNTQGEMMNNEVLENREVGRGMGQGQGQRKGLGRRNGNGFGRGQGQGFGRGNGMRLRRRDGSCMRDGAN